jgi:hypothetical protein
LVAGPGVLVGLLAELVYFWRVGVLRSHPGRVAIALLATGVGSLFVSGEVLLLLPVSWQPDRDQQAFFLLVWLIPGLVSCALLAPPLCWWAAKRRKILVRALAVLYACAAVGIYFVSGPPSRSPVRLARRFSGLGVPADARTIEFHDQASGPFGSDLDTHVDLALSPAAAIRLSSEARRRGYLPIASSFPSNEEVSQAAVTGLVVGDTGESEARAELGDGRAGLYRFERNGPSSYLIAVLDSARSRLFVRVLIM